MATFELEEILRATGGRLLQKGTADTVSGISTDTRTIRKGELYLPLSGENFNGHAFIGNAVRAGASVIFLSDESYANEIPDTVSVISVPHTLHALEDLARFHRMRFSIPVMAVTGSSGKTTTKDMLTAILETTYTVCRTENNFNNEIGLSKTLLSLTEAHEAAVVEMGMRGLGQIAELAKTARPNIGVVTCVGTAHIGILGSRDNIAKAKGELIEALPDDGTAILNADDEYVSKMDRLFRGKSVFYGIENKKDVYASDISFEPEGTVYTCHAGDAVFPVRLRMLGIHNVYDALAATAAGLRAGVSPENIKKALETFVSQSASQRVYALGGVTVLDDSYNANPLSVEMAFRAALQLPGARRILVLGDMLELGDSEVKCHEETGRKAAELGFDALITVGALSHYTAEGARAGGMKTVTETMSPAEAADILKKETKDGDVVLIKGSHAIHLETVAELWRGDLKS